MKSEIIQEVRQKNPLVHHLTNQVVMNFTANGLLSFGGSPIMAKAKEETGEMTTAADAVVINIGTLTAGDLEAMVVAGKAANKKGIPVLLDPVGVGATSFRSDAVKYILKEVKCTAIKGNAGELAHLVNIPWLTKGVDSFGSGDVAEIVYKAAMTFDTAAIITGKTDYFCISGQVMQNDTGDPLLTKVTGAGCLLGSIIAACMTTKYALQGQIHTALSFYGQAASWAAGQQGVQGPGTFLPHFIDALSLDSADFKRRMS